MRTIIACLFLSGCATTEVAQPRMVTAPIVYPLCVIYCNVSIQASDSEGSRVTGGNNSLTRNVTGGAQSTTQGKAP